MKIRIATYILLLISSEIILSCVAFAEQQAPSFEDYSVIEKYKGRNIQLRLSPKDKMYKTRLKNAAKQQPNFAGHYILAIWGCGAECQMGAAIDAKTGKVIWLPFTVCCWGADVSENFEPIEFHLDSRLIIFTGARNEKEGDKGKHYYKFENNRFVPIEDKL